MRNHNLPRTARSDPRLANLIAAALAAFLDSKTAARAAGTQRCK